MWPALRVGCRIVTLVIPGAQAAGFACGRVSSRCDASFEETALWDQQAQARYAGFGFREFGEVDWMYLEAEIAN